MSIFIFVFNCFRFKFMNFLDFYKHGYLKNFPEMI